MADLADIRRAIAEERFETARRLALAHAPADAAEREELALLRHSALVRLGHLDQAQAALAEAGDGAEALARRLDDLFRGASRAAYRASPEAARGLTYDEFLAGIHARRAGLAAQAVAGVRTAEQAARLRGVLRAALADPERRAPCDAPALDALDRAWPPPAPPPAPAPVPVRLAGRIRFPGGAVPRATVTLGVETPVAVPHPLQVWPHVLDVQLTAHGELTCLSAPLAADGSFAIAGESRPGRGFLALTLDDPGHAGVPTRYLARDLAIDGQGPPDLELVCTAWASAPPADPGPEEPAELLHAGRRWRRLAHERLANPFWHDFPRQDLRLDWPEPPPGCATLATVDGQPVPHQRDHEGRVLLFADLPCRGARRLGWYAADGADGAAAGSLLRVEDGGATAVLDTGRSAFRIPWGGADDGAAPILAAMGPDRVWRGQGRWRLPPGPPPRRRARIVADGPLECIVEIAHAFAGGGACAFRLAVHAGEEYLLVAERGDAIDGAVFAFGLEDFRGGRGYLHWCAEGEAPHWHDLVDADRELARLQETVPWWIHPAGFAWAASHDGLERRDHLGVFTRRRGDWVDHAFAAIAGGPPAGGHELDWPYPEMVGSTISMITVASTADGRLEMRFPRFAGERHWGLLASDVRRGDGPLKELQQVRHKTSFPRLDELRRWRLDEPDRVPRPAVAVDRARLPQLRRSLGQPGFAGLWRRVQAGCRYGDADAIRFAIDGDPATGWRLARRLAAHVPTQARCLLLSRENGDVWSPVGGRVWAPQALVFDAIAASGAFTPDEEREVRAGLLLAGHMFHSPDLMNWRLGSRNANFEADRIDVVGTVGMCFPGNPDADAFVAHALERMRAALAAYCTPCSGRWYENPACYYLHACKCRLAIASRLAAHGRLDLAAVERIDLHLGWLLQMLTPRLPAEHALMRDGCAHADYAAQPLVRRVAPIGDHAGLGPRVPEFAPIAARWLRHRFPGLAAALRWAWDESGRDGHADGGAAQLLAQSEDGDFGSVSATPPALASRRLEGFGAIFRDHVGRPDEFMLLAKLGPGGYRYHRSEGSFILVADGRPLVYDGGEAGEAWRHSAVTCHEVRMPPAPGRIERFASLPAADYAQGAHPVILQPGEPVFLSDDCDHRLVAEAFRRAAIAEPAAARAWLWVRDAYLVVWDRLDVAADTVHHWHLQVMADAESGDPGGGLRFRGRFGTDLQVALPIGGDRPWRVERLELVEHHPPPGGCVAQRHLEIAGRGPADWLAVLRPLPPGAAPVTAATSGDGSLRIAGDGIDDRLLVGRRRRTVADACWSLDGIAGALLQRPAGRRLVLLGPGRIRAGDAVLESDGPAAELALDGGAPVLHRHGDGGVRASLGGVALA